MLETKKILVIGDLMLDIYYSGEVNRISPEAPVPVFRKKTERYVLGGAANVAANLVAANQDVSIMGLICRDDNGEKLLNLLSEIGVDCTMLSYWDHPTITKIRFLAETNQQVLRLDIEDNEEISNEKAETLLLVYKRIVDKYDIILLSDYMKGLLTPFLTQRIIEIAAEHEKKVIVDVKDPDFRKYKGSWLLKPNRKELHDLTKMPVSTYEELLNAARYLLKESCSEYVLTTCGSKGMVLVGKDDIIHLDTTSRAVYDVTGAGDTTIAYLTAAVASELDIVDAIKIANHAAGVQVGKVGTAAVYIHEVQDAMEKRYNIKPIFHLEDRKKMIEKISEWRSHGQTIVTTNGCFDIIHRGHIYLLEEAKTYGDHLIVLLNTDASVKRLKGANRPINFEEDRAIVISSLDCVDAVALFDPLRDNKDFLQNENTNLTDAQMKAADEAPMGIMKQIAPDVHVKGGDYNIEQVPEAIYAKRFVAVPFVTGYSTTSTIEKSKK